MTEQQIITSKLEGILESVKDERKVVPIRIKVKTNSGSSFEESLISAKKYLQRTFRYERVSGTLNDLWLTKTEIQDLAKQPYVEKIGMG